MQNLQVNREGGAGTEPRLAYILSFPHVTEDFDSESCA